MYASPLTCYTLLMYRSKALFLVSQRFRIESTISTRKKNSLKIDVPGGRRYPFDIFDTILDRCISSRLNPY